MSLTEIRYRAEQLNGVTPLRLHGATDNLDAAAYQSLGMGDDDTFSFPATAQTIAVASTNNTTDTAAGAGALTVRVTGLDANYLVITEDFTLTGTTEADGSLEFLRVNDVQVLTAGANGVNGGDIWVGPTTATFTGGVPDTKYFFMETGWNRSWCAQYTVPASKRLVLERMSVTSQATASKIVTFRVEARDNGTAGTGLWEVLASHHISDSSAVLQAHKALSEKTDVRVRAIANAADADLSVTLEGILVDV